MLSNFDRNLANSFISVLLKRGRVGNVLFFLHFMPKNYLLVYQIDWSAFSQESFKCSNWFTILNLNHDNFWNLISFYMYLFTYCVVYIMKSDYDIRYHCISSLVDQLHLCPMGKIFKVYSWEKAWIWFVHHKKENIFSAKRIVLIHDLLWKMVESSLISLDNGSNFWWWLYELKLLFFWCWHSWDLK